MRWFLNCGKCGRAFHVSDGYEGMQVDCRQCGHRIFIPRAGLFKPAMFALTFGIALGIDYFKIIDVSFFPLIALSAILSLPISIFLVFWNPYKKK